MEDFLASEINEDDLSKILAELGSNFYPPAEKLTHREWLENILKVLNESPTTARVLRELK